jgi:putative ABC transport system ATP-binding protein
MIQISNMTKVYEVGGITVKALDNVSLMINTGEYVAIIGPSGSGKSTLMNMLGALDVPTSGRYLLNGQDVSKMNEKQLAKARNKHIGFVFQRYNLMGRISALRNVEMPARYGGMNPRQRSSRAKEALAAVGLADKTHNKPAELSGGQQQRVAIARALVNDPTILLADEPTGALDSKTGREILDLFEQLHRERGITIILVTHDASVARRANRVVSIKDGCIESDVANAHAGAPLAMANTGQGHEAGNTRAALIPALAGH